MRGSAYATAAVRPLARLYKMVLHALDGDGRAFASDSGIVWMPAHGALHTIGESRRSDGVPITATDWRANRLADGLAKAAARSARVPLRILQAVKDAAAAAEYAAALVGAACFAANNHVQELVLPDGTTTTVKRRDSTARKPGAASQRHCGSGRVDRSSAVPTVAAPAAPCAPAPGLVLSCSSAPPAHRRSSTVSGRRRSGRPTLEAQQARMDLRAEVCFQEWWRARMDQRCVATRDGSASHAAAECMEALRERVRQRARISSKL